MTQEKLKAIELKDKFYYSGDGNKRAAKIAADICVDEIIEALKTTTGHLTLNRPERQELQMDFDYWERVKMEVEKL